MKIQLRFYKRIETAINSIFYALTHYNNKILGFARKYYGSGRNIKSIILDTDFNILTEAKDYLRGEDPRCFIHNNELYIVDNYCGDIHLIKYDTKEYIKIPLTGKNFSFISHNNQLYIIHTMMPFSLYSFDIASRKLAKIPTDTSLKENKEYRGGTPGYTKDNKTYYGFGHRTHNTRDGLVHDIYYWEVDFRNENPRLSLRNIAKPKSAKYITDPTSIIEINNIEYLVTAESDHSWDRDQEYITNVYEIHYIPERILPSPLSFVEFILNSYRSIYHKVWNMTDTLISILYVITGIATIELIILLINKFISIK